VQAGPGTENLDVRRAKSGRLHDSDLIEVIGSMLKKRPFILCKVPCWHSHITKTYELRVLRHSLAMKKFNLCRVRHDLGKN
jgi:hypothetical protein